VVASFDSTSTALSDPVAFPNFVRLVPNDSKQATAMLNLIKKQGLIFVFGGHLFFNSMFSTNSQFKAFVAHWFLNYIIFIHV
jgi:hypothetical protein